jgi:hypothetical protein
MTILPGWQPCSDYPARNRIFAYWNSHFLEENQEKIKREGWGEEKGRRLEEEGLDSRVHGNDGGRAGEGIGGRRTGFPSPRE